MCSEHVLFESTMPLVNQAGPFSSGYPETQDASMRGRFAAGGGLSFDGR